jgi:6-phosphogluconolactonase
MNLQHSRRRFLAASAALPFALRALIEPRALAEPPALGGQQWVLLGTGTDEGIYRAPFDPGSGTLGNFEVAAATPHPSYLALHPTLPLLYAANELPEGDGQLSSFKLERGNANLTELAQASTQGNGACYVALDHTGRMAFGANYRSGSVAMMDVVGDGEFDNTQLFDCKNNLACGTPGPVKARQDGPHMHCAVVSPDNRFVLACDLGGDGIEIFPIAPKKPVRTDRPPREEKAPVQQRGPTRVSTRPGSGPRHLAFHPDGHLLYCINELDCTLEAFDWSVRGGAAVLQARAGTVVSTLPAGVSANADSAKPSTACELAISPNGKSLYANTRGANTLAVYAIDSHSGVLTEEQRIQTGGEMTRHFAFDPSRRWLLCANQGSSTITVFGHDLSTGRLGEKPRSFPAPTPMFVQFI